MEIARNAVITIRSFELTDAVEFTAACLESINTVGVWMPWCHDEYSYDEACEWIELCSKERITGNAYDLGIFRNSDASLAGSIAINQIDKQNRRGNVGYWVRESMQNQGYARQAVELITEFGFQKLGLVRLELVALTDNLASRRVAERAGADFECIASNRLIHNGQAKSAAVYSFTRGT